jgi:hypothetical protein
LHVCAFLLGYTDLRKTPISGYSLILTILDSILVQAVGISFLDFYYLAMPMVLDQYPFYVSKLLCLQFWVQDGSVHIYDLQTGQWVSSFEAAQGTEDL